MTTQTRRAIIALTAFSVLGIQACDRTRTPQQASADTTSGIQRESLSPAETASRLNRRRWNRDYSALGPMLDSGGRAATIRFLNSIDQVLDAHDQLQEAARKQFGDRIYRAWNISAMENNLGIFSREIRIINQSLQGDHAVVTIQAGENLPLVRSEFVRLDHDWILKSPVTDAAICESLDEFAMRIDDVAERVRSGLTPTEYFDAVTQELLPGMARVASGRTTDNATRVTDATADEAP
jgi:hypothetical protein